MGLVRIPTSILDQFSGVKPATIAEEIIKRWYYGDPLETNKK